MNLVRVVGVLALTSSACSGFTEAVDSDAECIESFLTAAEANPDLRLPTADEEAAGTFQAAHDWEGETPVCWINYRRSRTCTGFMYDIEGRWQEPSWVSSGTEISDECSHDDTLLGTAFG